MASTNYSVYNDITDNRKLLQSDLPFACYYSRIVQYLILQKSKSDCKAFLLKLLKKCLNSHENSSSKVITHWQYFYMGPQHKSVPYKWLALHVQRHVSHTGLLQPHFISCRGASGSGGNVVITEIYLSQSRFQP